MSWNNYHTHSYFCDGEENPQKYVEEAIKHGIKALGFSSHAPLPFPNDWTMKSSDLQRYCQLIRSLQRENEDKLQIFLGLEVDFIPGVIGPNFSQIQSLGLDYIIGSVHHVEKDSQGKYWSIDVSPETFAQGLNQIFGGDIIQAVEFYYSLIRQMVREAPPPILGHLDIIKKYNTEENYFSEDEDWYRKTVFDTLKIISKSSSILEVNTGGLARGVTDSLYPSKWILKRCFELGIPITLSSDAHTPTDITAGFDEAAAVLQDIGYKELYILNSKDWHPCPFTPEGLI